LFFPGWLLRHPIKKLANFQVYYSEELKQKGEVKGGVSTSGSGGEGDRPHHGDDDDDRENRVSGATLRNRQRSSNKESSTAVLEVHRGEKVL